MPVSKKRRAHSRAVRAKSLAASRAKAALHATPNQPDFQAQKGQLQEEIEASGHSVIFYPKFHCELNFIERFWCAAKHYTRENCLYTIESLRTTIPAAFRSISSATINKFYYHCVRTIEAYASGFTYGIKSFQEQVHKNHRQVPDASKW